MSKTTQKNYLVTRYPAPVLRKKSREIKTATDEIRAILADMVRTMRKNQGIGLAAPQIGLDMQLAVVDAGDGLLKLINPVVKMKDGIDTMDEGCLSIPAVLVRVKRAKTITVEYMDEWGKTVTQKFHGLTAKAIQHEIDHLNGRLILDNLPWYKRIFTTQRLKYL